VDSIDHCSEKGFAGKERQRSEILIRILPMEHTQRCLLLYGSPRQRKKIVISNTGMDTFILKHVQQSLSIKQQQQQQQQNKSSPVSLQPENISAINCHRIPERT